MNKAGRKITCECGTCELCKKREYHRTWRQQNPEKYEAQVRRTAENKRFRARNRYDRMYRHEEGLPRAASRPVSSHVLQRLPVGRAWFAVFQRLVG